MWPKIDDENQAYNLASFSAIKEEILPLGKVACYILDTMDKKYPDNLFNRYGNINYDNDDVISVYFGNNTGDNIYATLKGEKSIYTVSSQVIEDLNYTEEDLIQLDDYPSIGSGNLEKAVITKNKNSVVYDSADETQTEQIIAIAGGLGAVQLSTTADYCAEEKELSEYGLDEDLRAAVEVTYQEDEKEKKLTLYIGNRVGDDRYVMLNDSKIVYLVSDAICGNILNEEE